MRGSVLKLVGKVSPTAVPALSTTDAASFTIGSGGTVVLASSLSHPASDPFWQKSKPPTLFKYRDGAGSAGGLTLFQLKRRGPGYALKTKGKSDQLLALQGGAVDARLVLGAACYATTVPCVKKGTGLRCAP